MSLNHVRYLFQNFLTSNNLVKTRSVAENAVKRGRKPQWQNRRRRRSDRTAATTGLEVARFGLLSIATLPFSLWVALFSYDYVNRVSLCRDALTQQDQEILHHLQVQAKQQRDGTGGGPLIGRGAQLQQVRALLSQSPQQIIVVAGANESGKSRFVSELLRTLDAKQQRGVTYVQLSQIVDSLSTLTHALVRSFNLQWLQMRYALVDVLPFAGSEILVMKERFSDRDLAQSLLVATEALKMAAGHNQNEQRPVIIIDGLGEGSGWMRSLEGQRTLERLLQWCIYVTKERRLAHIILTGNEELVMSLAAQNKMTRGHVNVVGLGDLTGKEASQIVLEQIPTATAAEVKKITSSFGGFIHDLQSVSRDIQYKLAQTKRKLNEKARARIVDECISARFRLQVDRVSAAFAKGRDDSEDAPTNTGISEDIGDDMDPYLDPLKATYSEAQARQSDATAQDKLEKSDSASWSQLQLWQTLQRLVDSKTLSVSFAELRDDVFNGDKTPLLELMHEDVLGFGVAESSTEKGSASENGWSWDVKPATPAVGRVFQHLVRNSSLKERFDELQKKTDSKTKIKDIEDERRLLRRERRRIDERKQSLLKTVELGQALGREEARKSLEKVFDIIVGEELINEERGLQLRKQLDLLKHSPAMGESKSDADKHFESEKVHTDLTSIKQHLKAAVLETFDDKADNKKISRMQHVFEKLASSGSGKLTSNDLVTLIKMTTGDKIGEKAAISFIREWDTNDDKTLDYNEFVRMLLTDQKNAKKRTE